MFQTTNQEHIFPGVSCFGSSQLWPGGPKTQKIKKTPGSSWVQTYGQKQLAQLADLGWAI